MPNLHKSNRSLAKRIKITSTGKVTKRPAGQNHFNAKDSGDAGVKKHGSQTSPEDFNKSFQALLPGKNVAY